MLNFQILISDISDTKIMLALTIIISFVLYFKNKKLDALIVLFSSGLAMSITYTLKHLLKVPRPENMLVLEDGYRFPSGHATMAGVVSTLTIYFTLKYLHNNQEKNNLTNYSKYSYILYAFATLWLLLVCYSRLYLGVHYVVDVVTGSVIGIISTLLVIKISRCLKRYKITSNN